MPVKKRKIASPVGSTTDAEALFNDSTLIMEKGGIKGMFQNSESKTATSYSDDVDFVINIMNHLNDGIYEAEIKNLRKTKTGNLCINLMVKLDDNIEYPLAIYNKTLNAVKGDILSRFAKALKLTDSFRVSDMLNKKVYISVRVNEYHDNIYENVIDVTYYDEADFPETKNGYFI